MIAPKPVSVGISSGAENRSRPQTGAVTTSSPPDSATSNDTHTERPEATAEKLPPIPTPPDPPGTAYVAAVLSGALSPKPTTALEVYLRVGEWTPPDSSLRLADKII